MAAWSGLFDDVGGAPHALLVNKASVRAHIARMLKKRGARVIGEKLKTLLDDATPASTAAVTQSRVTHTPTPGSNAIGGVATIETRTQINTAVLAADVTDLQKFLEGGSEQEHQPTYPADASGNGGGNVGLGF